MVMCRSSVNFTASASKGSPSWNFTFGRSLMVTVLPSADVSCESASCGTMLRSPSMSNSLSHSDASTMRPTYEPARVGSKTSGSSARPMRRWPCARRGRCRDRCREQHAEQNGASFHDNPRSMNDVAITVAPGRCGEQRPSVVLARDGSGDAGLDHVAVERTARVRPRRHEVHVVKQPLAADAFEPRELGATDRGDRRRAGSPPDIPRSSRSPARPIACRACRRPPLRRRSWRRSAGARMIFPPTSRTRARWPCTTSGPASMLPATDTPGRTTWPHQSMQFAPVCDRDAALGVMHVKLALLGTAIRLGHVIDHGLRRHSLAQQAHTAITPERVRQRLRRERADAAFAVRTDRADREELACDRDAEGAAWIARDDGPCHGSDEITEGEPCPADASAIGAARLVSRARGGPMQPTFTTRPDIRGTFGAVATTHWLATQTGMAVLERGGNAFDAAVAAGFVLQIVEPHLNGPGGELPAIVLRAGAKAPEVICGQGPFPAAATPERLIAMGLEQMPGTGLLPAVVPGAFDGWMLLLRDYGTLHAARCALLRDLLRGERISAGAAHRRDDHSGGRLFPDRMAEFGRSVARQRQGAASRQAVPHAGDRRDVQAHPRAKPKPRAATASARSRPRATPTTKASSPRRSTASTAPS